MIASIDLPAVLAFLKEWDVEIYAHEEGKLHFRFNRDLTTDHLVAFYAQSQVLGITGSPPSRDAIHAHWTNVTGARP